MSFKAMSRSTKNWIVRLRYFQLAIRVLELTGALGVLVLMILTTNVDQLTAWILRITASQPPRRSVKLIG